ncbi:MAG: short chain dehydrogenase [Deltaproteobacteria bacterium]|nr:MAG: short chain dehydrogenase [Deltaproteobacteria bacterium]
MKTQGAGFPDRRRIMSKKPFKEKVVVITGAASGIGLALARKFAREGAFIGLMDMDRAALEKCEKQFADRGYHAVGVVCDVTRQAMCESAVAKITDAFGHIDVLVNNAGITQRSVFAETKVEVFQRVMDVNFFGALYCTKAALDSIIRRRGMIIVNESVAGFAPLLGRTGYSASKHALHGLFTSLRCELRHTGVHVMIVCPGFIKTNLQTRALGGAGNITKVPQSRVGKQDTPESAAEIIYRGAVKRKNMLVLTWIGKTGYWVSRITPVMYEKIMTRQFRSELS